ncbi:alkaline phosphatase D family protein [Arcticibacterium luteifluviistationis]|uniref:Phosphodiesterase n=1 Tax=Arcticibacterium luteifluviistationis TaxID=1784714 RepID=A0A2Z4G771_9BACT|nr:alkaline phosphatase D family protein [Arcticibacterium luteifluviistationis]AWV96923.1 phosphodiesterase [Arcticibacterium luteifluviistationis]
MLKRLLPFLLLCSVLNSFGQIVAGPMLGYSEMREVMLWVQTEKSAVVKYNYWVKGGDGTKFSTAPIITKKGNYFIAKAIADDVLPGNKYEYELVVNGKTQNFDYPLEFQSQTLWQYRTDPPAFKFAVGSCVYTNEPEFDRPGRGYGYTFDIFNKIYDAKPNFMVWGGDNIYLREVDFGTRSGIYKRYIDFKRQPELQKLFANTHHYATLDDHDFGPNDADRSYWGKSWALDAFEQNWGNPNYIFPGESVTGTFMWEDVQFFMMDNRSFRAPNYLNDDSKDYFGEKQLNWLIDALTNSRAPFKFVVTGGQVVNKNALFENMSVFPVEHKKLLDAIEHNNISGVIFITGDRHHTSLRKMDREGTYPIYDLTVSSLTSGMAKPMDIEREDEDLVPDTIVEDLQNFGILEVTGERTDRVLKINIIDNTGADRWNYEIKARDLRKPRD